MHFLLTSHQLIFFSYPPSLDLVVFFHLYPLTWSQVTATTHSPLFSGLQVDMNQSVRDKNGLTTLRLALGQKQHRLCCATQADIILFDPSIVNIFKHVSGQEPVPAPPLSDTKSFTVSPWESLQ